MRKFHVLLASLMMGALLGCALDEVLACEDQLPEDLRVLRTKAGCGPVLGFLDRPGMIEAPYLYGVLPGDKENSAAFWCQRSADEKPYVLVVVDKGRAVAAIPWEVFRGGLSRHDASGQALSDFRRVDDPKQRGPAGKTTEFPPLQSEYDGIITLFYRDGDQWFYQISH